MSDTVFTIVRGDTRISIKRDEFAEHPWNSHSMVCTLAGWSCERTKGRTDWLPRRPRRGPAMSQCLYEWSDFREFLCFNIFSKMCHESLSVINI